MAAEVLGEYSSGGNSFPGPSFPGLRSSFSGHPIKTPHFRRRGFSSKTLRSVVETSVVVFDDLRLIDFVRLFVLCRLQCERFANRLLRPILPGSWWETLTSWSGLKVNDRSIYNDFVLFCHGNETQISNNVSVVFS